MFRSIDGPYVLQHAAMAAFALSIALVFSGSAAAMVSHPADMACKECHLTRSSITEENAYLLVDRQEELCARCHEKAIKVSHPSGFPPMRMLPSAYPTDWKGEITCSTCHEVHGFNEGLMRGDKLGRELCLSCHDDGFFTRMADQGVSIQQKGHLARTFDIPGELIDPFSSDCMTCHNNNGLGPDGTKYGGIVMAHFQSSMKHPIGFLYSDTAGRDEYRDIDTLDKNMILPEGRLSCVTCHQGYSGSHGSLTVANNGSSLCFECHNL